MVDLLASVHETGSEGNIRATARTLSDEDAAKIAGEILSLFCRATDLADIPVGFEPRHDRTRRD